MTIKPKFLYGAIAALLVFCANFAFASDLQPSKRQVSQENALEKIRIKKIKTTDLDNSETLSLWAEKVLTWPEESAWSPISNPSLLTGLASRKIAKAKLLRTITEFKEQSISAFKKFGSNAWVEDLGTVPDLVLSGEESFDDPKSKDFYFAEKLFLGPNDTVIAIGDLHGSIHSLIRNLIRIRELGFLNDDFSLARSNTHFFFTGDFVDRGRHSAEVLYTLMLLKLKNPDNVHLLRGNHEEGYAGFCDEYIVETTDGGLLSELKLKYGDDNGYKMFKSISELYRFLPVVIFAGVEQIDSKSGEHSIKYIHFSHGGFPYDVGDSNEAYGAGKKRSGIYPHIADALLDAGQDKKYQNMTYQNATGYMWSDFCQGEYSSVLKSRGFEDSTSGAAEIGRIALLAYARYLDISLFIRGHQDRHFGLKMFFDHEQDLFDALARDPLSAENFVSGGPYHYEQILDKEDIKKAKADGFEPAKYHQVFTVSSASEGQALPYDCFIILHLSNDVSKYKMIVHEHELLRSQTKRPYTKITLGKSDSFDPIAVEFLENGPGFITTL